MKQTAKKTARGAAVVAGSWMLTLAAGMPAGAAINLDETIKVPGATPYGKVRVAGQEQDLVGVQDVTIRIQATQALADPVTVGLTGAQGCTAVDKKIELTLDAGATGAVTVSFNQAQLNDDGTTTETPFVQELEIPEVPAQTTEVVSICLAQ